MSVNKTTFEYLGVEYQERLLSQILKDRAFAEGIVKYLKPNYFTNETLKLLSQEYVRAYDKDSVLLDSAALKIRLFESIQKEEVRDTVEAYIDKIQQTPTIDWDYIQSQAFKFCKQQEVLKVVTELQNKVKKNQLDDADIDKYIELMASVGNIGKKDVIVSATFDDLDRLLSDEYRNPIPTGITKLDSVMNGGLSGGELAIILAALGVGKTTIATKIANTAYNLGKNVLQIFFEDSQDAIKRKHIACWSGHKIDELSQHKEEVETIINKRTTESGGNLFLVKMQSIDTTMAKIKNVVKRLKDDGYNIDVMLIDYIDCVQPSRSYADPLIAEGMIMREYENLLDEYQIAGYAMTQGNRSAIGSKVVDTDQMGGSIKKAQIGHFILSIARPIEQKREGKATMGILKSRFGADGIIFDNVIFNNATLQIEILPNIDGSEEIRVAVNHSSDMDVESKMAQIMKRMGGITDKK